MEGNPDQSILSPRYRFFNGLTKLDAAANLAKDVVEEVTGIPIDYWATFSFESFRRLIDALGGVDVVVDKTFDDYEYPANDNPQIDASYKHIHFQAGFEHMNGERAIEFARSRKSTQDGTDFARSKRQMKLVQAVKDKLAKTEMLLKAPAIIDALQGRIRTSLSASEVTALVDYLHSGEGLAKTKDLLFVSQILNSNFLYDVMSPSAGDILLPQAGQGNYKAIQDWLRLGLLSPQLRYEDIPVQLQNGTGLSGYGGKLTEELGNKRL